MKTKTIYKIVFPVIILLIVTGMQKVAQAQTHVTLLCGDNGSQITGSVTPLNLTGNVYVFSVGTGNNGAVITVPVGLGDATRTFSVQNSNADADLTVSGVISGTPGVLKLENGNLKLGGSNVYQDATKVLGGMLQLGIANAVPANPLVLNGGTFSTGDPGWSNAAGVLMLAENSAVELGTGSHILAFANSSAESWTPDKTITIYGWEGNWECIAPGVAGRIFIGTDKTGLTIGQLNQVRFFDGSIYFPATLLSTGELVPKGNDQVAPVINCPGPVTFNMNSGCTYTGSFDSASATDNCPASVTVTHNAPDSFPEGVTTVTWTATDLAGNVSTCAQEVTVLRNAITGTLKYNNAAQTPLNAVELTISPAGTNTTSVTDEDGNYSFAGLCAGTYTIEMTGIDKEVGYINSTDASQINAWAVSGTSIERVKWMAGDVTFSGGINSTDAKAVQNYFVYFWPFVRGEWAFWKAGELVTAGDVMIEIPVNLSGNLELNLYGQAVGDFNGSFVPGNLKAASSTLDLTYGETRLAGTLAEIELPVRILNSEIVSAASLILDYPAELLEVTDVEMKLEIGNLDWMAKGGELRIGWNSLTPLWLEANSLWLTIHGRTTESFGEGDEIRLALAPDPLNELADGNYNVIPDAKLMTEVVAFSTTGIHNPYPVIRTPLTLESRPNPFSGYSILEYGLPIDGHVTLEITDLLGRKVALLVDEHKSAGEYSMKLDATPLQPGVYMATLKCGEMVKTIKLVRD